MSILVIAEHDNSSLKPATLNAVTAAATIGGEITVLVAGQACQDIANSAAQISGVAKVLLADNSGYAHQLPENVAPLVVDAGQSATHILAAATTTGKNILPRVAALLNVAQ
ncbi:MAG TPA: electron transfer flavoprotein subunit alpha/FixB family protein, partial [Gammaproteobacteria bacterium]|nr:electron transfer flavoprotein subunit alpha/FixB family protein [Gammaproteobacteria bacterium]